MTSKSGQVAPRLAPTVVCFALCVSALAEPPPNDLCANALRVTAGSSTTGSTVGATPDLPQSCGGSLDNRDVWFAFLPPATGDYTLDTLGSTFDTVLAVYSACGGTRLACDDDIDYPTLLASELVLSATAGVEVRIRIAGWSESTGAYVLNISAGNPVLGACCTGTTCVVANSSISCAGVYQGDFSTCTVGAGGASPCCRADFDGTGGVNVADIFTFLAAWFDRNPGANMDDNPAVEVPDIFVFLSLWFAGC